MRTLPNVYRPYKRSGIDLIVTLLFTFSFWGYVLFLAVGVSGFGGFLVGRWSMAGQKAPVAEPVKPAPKKFEKEVEQWIQGGEHKDWMNEFWPPNLKVEEGDEPLSLETVEPRRDQ